MGNFSVFLKSLLSLWAVEQSWSWRSFCVFNSKLCVCVFLLSHLCGSSEKDEFCRSQTPAVPVPEGPPSCRPGDGCHAAWLGLPTTCGHQGPQTPGCLPRVLAEEPLSQQEETPPRRQPAGRHRQCDHLLQPGLAVTRELWSWQEKSAVRTINKTIT